MRTTRSPSRRSAEKCSVASRTVANMCICFASEPKAILTSFPEERQPDHDEIGRLLAGHYPDAGEATFFTGIRHLRPARCLVISQDAMRESEYWGFQSGSEAPVADAEERFRTLLRESIDLRMRSDLPVGACLSDGLDSSAIAALVDVPDGPRCSASRYATPGRRRTRVVMHGRCVCPRGLR